MASKVLKTILLLLVIVTIIDACPGLFGAMGGGGGGCGCGAPPPPPSPCGCGGGRKKRSLAEKPAKPEFFGIASNDQDALCNSPELKKIIFENMHKNPVDSTKAVQNALEHFELQRYVVVCTETNFVYTVRADTAYCGARNNNHYCHVFAI